MNMTFNSGFGMGGMHDVMFSVFPVIFMVAFVAILGVFIATAVKGISRWHTNNNSPRLTVPATVVAKRDRVRHSSRGVNDHHHSTWTYYYVTFEVESGDRMELEVEGEQFGLLVEGDRGQLTFQGTRFVDFQRDL